jgi:hypothetical protein
MNMIASFKVPVAFYLDYEQQQEARRAINTYYLGEAECNYLDPGTKEYLPKHPEKETKEFKEASKNVSCEWIEYVTVGLDSNGCLSLIS